MYSWSTTFRTLFDRCVAQHRKANTSQDAWYSAEDRAFLASIGYTGQEFFDFVDDFCRYNEDPSFEAALLIAAARRDYFLVIQKGKPSTHIVKPETLPAKTAAVDGIAWLPRIIVKARAKLRGEMDQDTMFGCGGDRAFCHKYNIHLADFLRVVWAAEDDDKKIIDYVKSQAALA